MCIRDSSCTLQLLVSVIVRQYVPGSSPLMAALLLLKLFGPVQLKVYDGTPPNRLASMLPSLMPAQLVLLPLWYTSGVRI